MEKIGCDWCDQTGKVQGGMLRIYSNGMLVVPAIAKDETICPKCNGNGFEYWCPNAGGKFVGAGDQMTNYWYCRMDEPIEIDLHRIWIRNGFMPD